MAKSNNTVDFRIKLAIESKEYNQALREANQEAKEFKKQQRDSFKTAGKDAGDAFSTIVAMAKKAAPAISAGAVAFQVMNKAMQENQTFTDEWARITESARASYESFVNALVNTDLSSWFKNFDAVIGTARELADAFDALDTAKIFNSREMAALRAEAAGYALTLKTSGASEEEKSAAAVGLKNVRSREQAEMQRMSNQYFETFAKEFAARMTEHGSPTNWQDILTKNANGLWELSKDSKYQTYFRTLDDYNAANEMYKKETELRKGELVGFDRFGKEIRTRGKGAMSDADYYALQAAVQLSDEKLQKMFNNLIAAYSGQTQYLNTLRSDQRMLGSALAGGGGGKVAAPVGSIAYLREQIAVFQKEYEMATEEAARNAAKAQVEELQNQLDIMINGKGQKYGNFLNGLETLNPKAMSVSVDPSTLKPLGDAKPLENAAKDTTKYIDVLTESIQSLGLISVKSNSDFAKVLTITQTFLELVKMMESGSLGGGGKWYNHLLRGIGSIFGIGFAGGGIVGGTSYRGDRLPAMVNSGEMFLNGFQQKQLFDMINKGGANQGGGSAVVTGENIYIALRNYGRRSGKRIIIE